MKRDNVNYFLVGSVVLIGIALMLYSLFRLTGGVGENDQYYTSYRNVGGLNEGTPVTYQGYKLGSVASIKPVRLEGKTSYRITVMIRDGWKVPDDSIARIYSEGLLAETVINIEEGSSSTFLEPGAEIEGRQGFDVFQALNSVASEASGLISTSVRPLVENINGSVLSVSNQVDTRLPEILDELSHLVATLQAGADRVPRMINDDVESKIIKIVGNSEKMSANLLVMSEELLNTRRAMDALLGQSSETVKSADILFRDSRSAVASAESLLLRSHQAIESIDSLLVESQDTVVENRSDLRNAVLALKLSLQQVADYTETILHNLEGASRHMNEFSREIRDNPALLLGGKPARESGVVYE